MKKGTILSVDLGTSALKVVLYDSELTPLRFEKQTYTKPGQELRADDWWNAFCIAIKNIASHRSLSDVLCISLSGYNAFVGLDRNLQPSTLVVLYSNSDPSRHIASIMGQDEAEYIFSKTSNRLFAAGMMAPIIRWLKDTCKCYDESAFFTYSNGFIAARLTGRVCIDAVRASISLLHDPRKAGLNWEKELCDFFGIDIEKLPDILAPWESVGSLSTEAAEVTGLPIGIPVLAGAMDSMCAALGSGLTSAGQVLDIGGSAGGLAVTASQPVPNYQTYLVRYSIPGYWCNIAPLGAGSSLFPWFVEHFTPHWTLTDFFDIVAKTPEFSGGLQFLPYVGNTRHPYWTPDSCGHFLNIKENVTLPEMGRAVMEGLACAHRRILDEFHDMGIFPGKIIACGRDSLSLEWTKTKANFMQVDYYVSKAPERSAKGCAILAAKHLGIIDGYDDPLLHKDNSEIHVPFNDERDNMKQHEEFYKLFLDNCKKIYNT